MNANTARNIFSVGVLASLLAACGGGGDESTAAACNAGVGSLNPAFCAPRPEAVTGTQAAAPLSLAPAALTVGNCTTRIPFIFSGGIGPFTIFTSDNFNVPVSSALSLGDGRSYFFADVKYPAGSPRPTAVLTVLDSQSRTAVANVTTPPSTDQCFANPLLLVSPESANFRTSEILAFQVSGGPTPLALTVACDVDNVGCVDDPIVSVAISGSTVTVQAKAPGTKLMTVEAADRQRASIVIRVLPQP